MNLIIDEGNTLVKCALFHQNELIEQRTLQSFHSKHILELFKAYGIKRSILSSTKHDESHFDQFASAFPEFIFMNHCLKTPLKIDYETPQTLGKDRLAAAVGAFTLFPGNEILIADAGTALTFDYVTSKGVYLGGTISPGLTMRLKALHAFTSKLPLVESHFSDAPLGKNTTEAIQQGSYNGILHEINGIFEAFLKHYPKGKVLLTGGDADCFEKKLKNTIFVNSNLVLIGLNTILEHNAN